MQFFQYIPSPDPIGLDLRQMLGYSGSWLSSRGTPYVGPNQYPPLASALFAPLLLLDFASAYRVVTVLSVACYVGMTLGLPVLSNRGKGAAIVLLALLTGLVSYGLQFELERGQFNVISVFLVLLAIWIFHRHRRYSMLAYALFAIAVQLKIYPFIFVLMFIRNWRARGENIRRILLLALVNFALFFALGSSVFMDFMHATARETASPYVWVGNHSITAFTTLVVQHATPYGWLWLNQYSGLIQLGLLIIVAACICLVLSFAQRRESSRMDAYLLLACTLGALLIPSTSHDYTLSILAAPVAMFYAEVGHSYPVSAMRGRLLLRRGLLVLMLSVAYASTLFSFVSKPGTFIIANNFPALMAMLIVVTGLAWLSESNPETSEPEQPAVPAAD
jgi:hypothetical protein